MAASNGEPDRLQGRIFLCHSAADKTQVRNLYTRLRSDGFEPWLDEEDLHPGDDWEHKIVAAVKSSAVVVVCLSSNTLTKAGYVHKEIACALDMAAQQPDDRIFIIPLRLDECKVPDRITRWQWVNLFEPNGYERLASALEDLRLRGQAGHRANTQELAGTPSNPVAVDDGNSHEPEFREIALIIGILSPLSQPDIPLENRVFVRVDRWNFDNYIDEARPGLSVAVRNVLSDLDVPLKVSLQFDRITDFEPGCCFTALSK
jgi:hypothetical protein